MKHPTLFDLPASDPNRPSLAKQISAFKSKHKIITHHAPQLSREEEPWLAWKRPKDDIEKALSDWDYMSRYSATSTGELSAIRKLCKQLEEVMK